MKTMKNILLSVMAAASLLNAGGDITPVESPIIIAEPENTWSYEFQLYGLAIWINGDATIGALPSGKVDESPKSIIDKLEMGAMAHFEAHQNNGWGLWLDYVFMNLGMGATVDKSFVNLDARLDTNIGIYQGILEAFATYRVPMEKGYMDYYGGVRWWHNAFDLKTNLNISGIGSRIKYRARTIDWYDPVLGARWTYPLNENWSFRVRGDVGGFGIQSDFSTAIEVGALYDINENWQVDLRFKSLWVDYEEGTEGTQDYFAYDTANFGPIIGITYKF
jgi:hypothetical protein